MAPPNWTTLRDPQRPTRWSARWATEHAGHGTSHSIRRTQAELALGSWGQDRTNMKHRSGRGAAARSGIEARSNRGCGPLLNRTNSRLPILCTSAEFLDITFQDYE